MTKIVVQNFPGRKTTFCLLAGETGVDTDSGEAEHCDGWDCADCANFKQMMLLVSHSVSHATNNQYHSLSPEH